MAKIWGSGLLDQGWEWFDQNFLGDSLVDSTPVFVAASVVHYAIEIDVSDNTDDPDENAIGLFNDALLNGGSGGSAFRWITERPDYDGSTVVPTGELTTANAIKWAEGMITNRRDLGAPNRLINVNVAGNYGSLSGFQFSINNTKIESGTYLNELFFDVLDDNNIYLLNRRIRFFVVIDDVFYNYWSGVISKVEHDETRYSVTCEDDFKNVHKTIPPEIATENSFPDILKKSIGKPVPVTLGNVNQAKLLNVRVKNGAIEIAQRGGVSYKVAPIHDTEKTIDGDGNHEKTFFKITVGEKIFGPNELNGKFIRIILDGGGETAYKITSTLTTVISSGVFAGQSRLEVAVDEDVDLTGFVNADPLTYDPLIAGTWAEIFDFESVYVASNRDVQEYPQSELGGRAQISYFDKDQAEFIEVSEVLDLQSLDDVDGTGKPGIKAFTGVVDFEGKFVKLFPIKPKKVTQINNFEAGVKPQVTGGDLGAEGTEYPELIDQDISTKRTIEFTDNTDDLQSQFSVPLTVEMPDEVKGFNFERFYILVDIDITSGDPSATANGQTIVYFPVNIYGQTIGTYNGSPAVVGGEISQKTFSAGVPVEFRLIPPSYYGESLGVADDFGRVEETLDGSTVFENTDAFLAFPSIAIGLRFGPPKNGFTNNVVTFEIYEIAIAGSKEISIINDDLFIKTKGEKTTGGTNETANVYRAFEAMLVDYDGLDLSADLDLSGIETRKQWGLGRQLLERKQSFTYLKELAAQSFVGLFPSRTGKRKLVAFRDLTEVTKVFANDNGTIIKNSISRFELTPFAEIYNEYDIKYEQNVANDRFDKSVFIKNVDVAGGTFPGKFVSTSGSDTASATFTGFTVSVGIDGEASGVATWASVPAAFQIGKAISYDGGGQDLEFGLIIDVDATTVNFTFENKVGFADGDTPTGGTFYAHGSKVPLYTTYAGGFSTYSRAKTMWEVCRDSYDRTRVIRPLPDQFSDCRWYVDHSNFEGMPAVSSAEKYLESLVEWSTRQKEIVEFDVPLTIENSQLELLDFVQFRDQKYTAAETRNGYIQKIKLNPGRDVITLALILIPEDIADVSGCLIVETGTNTDTIVESGSETDTIVETGTC